MEQYPLLEAHIDQVLPKKENFKLVKCKEHLELIADPAGGVQFVKVVENLKNPNVSHFQHRDVAQYIPTLRLLHKYPFLLPHQQVSTILKI